MTQTKRQQLLRARVMICRKESTLYVEKKNRCPGTRSRDRTLKHEGTSFFTRRKKRKNMLIIACIMLFAILFTLVPSFSFSVTAARRNTGSVAEEYVRYQSRLQNIEKITDLEENGFRLLEDQVFAMPLQKVPEDTPEEAVDEVWFYAALDKQYHRLAVFLADDNGQILYKTDQLEANYCYP